MFQALADRLKSEAAYSFRAIILVAVATLAAAVALGFLVAALFVWIANSYGPLAASLACAALFILLALILVAINAIISARHKRALEARRAALAAATPSPFTDPRLIMIAFQIAQAIGLKRILPLAALGGAAFFLATRNKGSNSSDS